MELGRRGFNEDDPRRLSGTSGRHSTGSAMGTIDNTALLKHLRRMKSRAAKRCDYEFHKKIQSLTESQAFNMFIIFIIFANAFFMALETDEETKASMGRSLEIIDTVFLTIYMIEFVLKLYAEPVRYWKSYYNLFDFAVLAISLIQAIIAWANPDSEEGDSSLSGLKVLRALRTLRTLRTVSFIRGLQVLVTALLDTIRTWVINILMLLQLLVFLFAIMGYYIFGYKEDGDKENFGTLGRSMLSLYSLVTVDGWTDLQENLDKITKSSRIYSIIFIFLGHFIFTNIFIGVIIINISEATENYKKEQQAEREAVVERKKEYMWMRQNNDVKALMDRQKKGDYETFGEMIEEFSNGLRHEDSVMVSDICTNILWLETYITVLDNLDTLTYRSQQLQFEIANFLASKLEADLEKKNPSDQAREDDDDALPSRMNESNVNPSRRNRSNASPDLFSHLALAR